MPVTPMHIMYHQTGGGGGERWGWASSKRQPKSSSYAQRRLVEIDSQGFTNAAWSTLQRDGADVVCPTTGQIEFFMQAKSGLRDNSVAFAKIPAAGLRATPTVGEMQVALGCEPLVWDSDKQSRGSAVFKLKGQDGQTSALTATIPF